MGSVNKIGPLQPSLPQTELRLISSLESGMKVLNRRLLSTLTRDDRFPGPAAPESAAPVAYCAKLYAKSLAP